MISLDILVCMKLWMKYVLGIALGMIAAFILPLQLDSARNAVTFLFDLAIRFGRYTLLPLLFFSVASAMFKLRANKMVGKTALWVGITVVVSSLLLTIIGLLSILIVKLPRIPITNEQLSDVAAVDIKSLILQLAPFSTFTTLHDGLYLLPAFVFASLAGAGSASDPQTFKPVITLFEAAAKLCYSIMSFFLEFMAVAMIAVGCYWLMLARDIFALKTFAPLLLMLTIDFVIVVGILYPLIVYLVCKDRHPYHVLYASLCPILTAFFTADANVALLVNIKHGRDSLGIHRRINGVSYPLFTIFAKGGSALVASICFIMILRSYSNLGFELKSLVWIFGMTFFLSFAMCALPTGSAFVMLTIMCGAYSGFESGYLLLRPATLLLCSFAAAFDAASAMFGTYIVAVKNHAVERIALRRYV